MILTPIQKKILIEARKTNRITSKLLSLYYNTMESKRNCLDKFKLIGLIIGEDINGWDLDEEMLNRII